MKPANWSLDRKRFLIIAFTVILFFSNSFIRVRAGKVSLLGRLHTTFHKKNLFSGKKKNLGMLMWRVILVILGMFGNFGLDNVNVALLRVKFPLSRLKY